MKKTMFVLMLVCCFALPRAEALLYDYGGVYEVDFPIVEHSNSTVYIRDSVSGVPTIVNLVSGGSISCSVAVQDTSEFNMYAGMVGRPGQNNGVVFLYDSGKFNMYGGLVGATVYLRGGEWLVASGGSEFNLYGGTVGESSFSEMRLGEGGSSDEFNVYGGSVTGAIWLLHTSEFNMYNGSVGGNVKANGTGSVYLRGGAVGGDLLMWDNSSLIVEGSGFNYPYGTYTSMMGILTGTLLNGDLICTPFELHGYSTMTLIPEPATLTLLCVGVLCAIRRKR